jgi:hypothetical protein
MFLLFLCADVRLVQFFEIDEVEECAWHIKIPSRNVHIPIMHVHTKAHAHSRNVHTFLLGHG